MDKLLIVTPYFPLPLYHGGAIAQDYFFDGLKDQFEIILVARTKKTLVATFEKMHPEIRVYNIPQVEYKTHFFIKLLNALTIRSRNLLSKRRSTQISISEVISIKDEIFLEELTTIIENEKPTLIQLDFFDTLDLIPWLKEKELKVVFVHHEIRSKRLGLEVRYSNKRHSQKDYLNSLITLFEYKCLEKANQVIVFNEQDQALLGQKGILSKISPFAINRNLIFKNQPSLSYHKFIFIGSESNSPNREGLEWFLNEIYIPTHSITRFDLLVIGSWSKQFRKTFKSFSKIRFAGYIEDLSTSYEGGVLVAPILSGSGLRTKILHALANWTPVFSTPFAAEGLFKESECNYLKFFSSSKEFLDLIHSATDTDLKILAEKGHEYFSANFEYPRLVSIRAGILRDTI